jgi:hypothetical protein
MILNLLRHSEFSDLAKLCSPSLFRVLSASAVAGSVKALMASRAPGPHAALCERHASLHEADDVGFDAPGAPIATKRDEAARTATGERLLRLYFRQLLHAEDALLDMRPSAFGLRESGLTWTPAPLSVRWDPAFLGGLRDTYRGFYGADDARFRRGLAALDLRAAEELFRYHFGDDPRAVRFSTKDFTHTFGLVFEACAKSGAKLSADFLPFGFLLGALYTSLEALDVPLDVRAAFEAADATRVA